MTSSALPLQTTSGDRYAALVDLIAVLATVGPAEALPLVLAGIRRCVPLSSFTVAAQGEVDDLAPLYHSGEGGVPRVDARELVRLRSGGAVIRAVDGGRGTLLLAPLRKGDRMWGWLGAARADGGPFTGDDADFLAAVVGLVGMAMAPTASEEADEDARVDELAHELTASLELAAVVNRIVLRVHDLVREPVALWLVDGERSRAVARAGGAPVRLGEEQLLRPELFDPLREGSAVGGLSGPDRLVVSLVLGTRVVGMLEVGPWAGAPPDPRQLRVLHRLAPPMASAIENARLHEEVRRLSLTDPVVHLPNRRQLDLYLAKECAAAVRGRPLSMVLFDLDRFKQYNDTHGHLAGDTALIRFAGVLRSETRAMNLACRFGGEEFATVLSEASLEGARTHAERVRQRVQEIFDSALTVSAGVADWRPGMERPADLIAAADRQLYRAKLEGRNRVCVAEA